MNVKTKPGTLTPDDFATDQDVRWCPGCGDYAILKAVQKAMPDIGVPREKIAFISGIGCAARFPYYMETYGFHTIHGRAPAIATGLKLANPDLSIWVVMGDGDGLSIGGNHLMHALRRNVDLNLLLFNNEVYGLTKGQYSPTSHQGQKSPSTPGGSLDAPLNPARFALGAGARFVARTYDIQQKVLPDILKRAAAFKGASFVDIFQNCIVYNDGVFDPFLAKKTAADTQVQAEHGQPLIYGKERNKGLRLNTKTLTLEPVTIGEEGVTEADILVHDETNRMIATLLAEMDEPHLPVALGVLYCAPGAPSYEEQVAGAAGHPAPAEAKAMLARKLASGATWTQ